MMPQWEFLDFLRDEAKSFPGFPARDGGAGRRFVEERGRVAGVRLRDGRELRAPLTIAADGRSSIARPGILPLEDLGAPMDVFWFRLAKSEQGRAGLRGNVERGRMLVMIDRGDYWQCAFLIPKGAAEDYQARGIDAMREEVAAAAPPSSTLGRTRRDHRPAPAHRQARPARHLAPPGLLAIGDAAHAMSPIGGIGINLAIQDAVAAANILAGPLARGRERRSAAAQGAGAAAVSDAGDPGGAEGGAGTGDRPSAPVRRQSAGAAASCGCSTAIPLLRRIPGRIIGLGVRRERVRSPAAPAPRTP